MAGLIAFASWLAPLHPQSPPTADALLRMAFVDFAGGKWESAAKYFSEFLNSYGASAEAQTVRHQILPALAGCYIQLRRGADAIPIIEQYLSAYPNGENVEEMTFWIGLAHFMEQSFAEALPALQNFLQKFPSSRRAPDARMLIGVCLFQEMKYEQAAEAFAEAARFSSDPLDVERSRLMRLQCFIELKDKDRAFSALNDLRKQERPLNQQVLLAIQSLAIGDLFFEDEEYDKAYRCYLFVPLKQTLIDRQNEVLADVRRKMSDAQKRGVGGAAVLQRLERLEQSLVKELGAIEKMVAFDATRHLRLAQCSMLLGRYREAYVAAIAVAEKSEKDALASSGHYMAILASVSVDRWDRALRDIRTFIERYPKHERITSVAYLEGQALMGLYEWAEAASVFKAFHEKYPAAPEAPRALFLSGYCVLFNERYDEATNIFTTFRTKYPSDPLAEQNAYWYAMTSVFAKDWPQVIQRFGNYLSQFPQGAFRADAEYRIGLAHLRLKDFNKAIELLITWIRRHEGHILQNEVFAALGDAYFAEGLTDEGIATFNRIRADENRKLFDYGQFQIGRVYRELEQPQNVIDHFKKFVAEHGESSRIIEALNQIAWGYRALEQPDEARAVYVEAINRFANDPKNTTVEQILQGLAGITRDPDARAKMLNDLRNEEQQLRREKKYTHAARNLWLYSRMLRREEPISSKRAFTDLIENYEKEIMPASMLAEIGEFLIAEDRHAEAEPYFKHILEVYGGSAQKNQALAGLGLLYAKQGLFKDALRSFERLIKEAPQSSLMAKVLEARGDIFVKQKKYDEAIADYMQILEIPTARGLPWVRALFRIGQAHEAAGRHLEATAFYERIYLLYARHREWVAKAYLARGRALEELNKYSEALEVYREMLAKEELVEFPEFRDARARATALEVRLAS